MTWPGKAADDWWDALSTTRKEQIHGWVEKASSKGQQVPEDQLLLEVPDLEQAATVRPSRA